MEGIKPVLTGVLGIVLIELLGLIKSRTECATLTTLKVESLANKMDYMQCNIKKFDMDYLLKSKYQTVWSKAEEPGC